MHIATLVLFGTDFISKYFSPSSKVSCIAVNCSPESILYLATKCKKTEENAGYTLTNGNECVEHKEKE